MTEVVETIGDLLHCLNHSLITMRNSWTLNCSVQLEFSRFIHLAHQAQWLLLKCVVLRLNHRVQQSDFSMFHSIPMCPSCSL
jgi:hypothetical protein